MKSVQGLESAQWEEALRATAEALGRVKGNEISFIAGKLADAESLIAAKVRCATGHVTFPKACLVCHAEAEGTIWQLYIGQFTLGRPCTCMCDCRHINGSWHAGAHL